MTHFQYRLIDTAGGEIGIINDARKSIQVGDSVRMADGSPCVVVEVYDDENGKEGYVEATLVIEE